MTLEEAKKEIEDRMHAYWRGFKGWDEEHWHDQRGNPYYEGKSDGLEEASGILDKVEPVGNSDKITLKELAHELRKVFRFKFLVACKHGTEIFVTMYQSKPEFVPIFKGWDRGRPAAPCPIAVSEDLRIDLDLSEYKDADSNIDYSKCIVGVE